MAAGTLVSMNSHLAAITWSGEALWSNLRWSSGDRNEGTESRDILDWYLSSQSTHHNQPTTTNM
jgi:hypothetical protein